MLQGYQISAVTYNPFSGPELEKTAPATESQLEIWASCLIGGVDANRSYNESLTVTLKGTLDEADLERSLQALIDRHEALRTVFNADGSRLCIMRNVSINLLKRNLTGAQTPLQQQQLLDDYNHETRHQVFDLVRGPLFKLALFKIAADTHHLIITVHHIICDGWSFGIMVRDLSIFYNTYQSGAMPMLPAAPAFSEYAVEQYDFLKTKEYKVTEQFWMDKYRGDVPVVNLPTDFPRPAQRTYKSQRDDFFLPDGIVNNIKALGKAQGCSFVTTLMSAFEVFLSRVTGQNNIVLGLPAAGQSVWGYYGLVGHCVNLLPVRSTQKPSQTFTEYLAGRKPALLDAFDNQTITFGTLLKKLNIQRDASRVPLVPVMINMDMGLDEGVDFDTLDYKLTYNPRSYENFEIFLNVADADGGLSFEWSYNTQLFKPETISAMMDDFVLLLQEITGQPDVLLKNLLSATSTGLLSKLNNWNNTAAEYPAAPLHELITASAGKHAERTALRFNGDKMSYIEVDDKANRLANILVAAGLAPGDRAAVAMGRSFDLVIALLAVLKTGAAYVPVDPSYPQERVDYMLNDSGSKLLVTSAAYQHLGGGGINKIIIEQAKQNYANYPATTPVVKSDAGSLAYIIYTSGSTGQPKGVQIEHGNLVNFLYSMQKVPGMTSSDKLLAVTTISFDIAGLELYLPLLSGAELVIADEEAVKDGRKLLQLIDAAGITVMQATPATWRMLLEVGWDKKKDIKVLCGGEALSLELAHRLSAKCGALWNMYGPTETAVWSAVKEITEESKAITLGKPIANTQVYIMNENLQPVDEGVAGEICIGGDGVARGYWNRPGLTAEKFIVDGISLKPGARLYRTGDLGKFNSDGELVYLGRIDRQVKIRGYRIEPEEVERQLLTLPGIKQVAVVADTGNEQNQRLLAFIVPADAAQAGEQEPLAKWKTALDKILPYYMVPDQLLSIPAMPLTLNSKIDVNALLKLQKQISGNTGAYVAPSTPDEEWLAIVWAELLGLDKVSVQDDFFELGGHSLIAAKLMAVIETKTGTHLPLATLFSYPTIEKLANVFHEYEVLDGSLVAIKPTGKKMPIFIVHGAGLNVLIFNFLSNMVHPDQPVYALQAKGINGVDTPADDISELAAYYISEILSVHPEGPVALGGYSMGGIIALEMAKQLQQMGKEVKMLAMIDSYAELPKIDEPIHIKLSKKFTEQFAKLGFVIESMLADYRSTIRYQSEIVKNKIKRKLGMQGIVDDVEWTTPLAKEIYTKIETAFKDYKITPYDGVISIFKAKVRAYYVHDPVYLGWKPFARKGTKIYEVPGDHAQLFKKENNQVFANLLQQALDDAVK